MRPEVETLPLGDGGTYRLHRWSFPLRGTRLDLVDLGMTGPLDAPLRDSAGSLLFNAGFFTADGRPDGLSMARGREESPLRRELSGGVLTIGPGGAQLHASETFELPGGTRFAVQCRPRLVVDGQVNIRRDDGRRADRTALCIRDDGARLDLYIARTDHPTGMGGPTLFALAGELQRRGCRSALNLDGGPSTGVAWRQSQTELRVLRPRGPVRQGVLVTIEPQRGPR